MDNYLALYRKYRPDELDDVVGQEKVKKILASSVKNGMISHAYLFSGPRGTGKTTMAKILAKMVNCLHPVDGHACNKCEICKSILNSNDVIEIDAASNNGVDEIRDLKEKATLVPSNAKYKVYIIDEVHMLTTQAFNALLKTLEEPPKHVIFILATTEYYKIPLTITSRCQKFQFEKITVDDIVDRLKNIAKKEKISIDESALVEIARVSDGGLRDSINFLDQLRSFNSGKITVNDVYSVCGNVSNDEMLYLLTNIRNNNVENINAFFDDMNNNGKNYAKFLESFIDFLKNCILFNKNVNYNYLNYDVDYLKKINEMFSIDELFSIIEVVDSLIIKLRTVSRQSVIVTTNFLLLMNKLNNDNSVKVVESVSSNNNEEEYGMAFQFTLNSKDNNTELTDNVAETNNEVSTQESDVVLENKKIIINNTFAVADKNAKMMLQKAMDNISEYLTDKKFKVAASTLLDAKVEVAGDMYVIFSANNNAIVDKVYGNYKLCSEFINMLFNGDYKFAILSNDEWLEYRGEYVNNFKNGKKYVLMNLIDDQPKIEEIKPTDNNSVVDRLFDLVGEENVEFR